MSSHALYDQNHTFEDIQKIRATRSEKPIRIDDIELWQKFQAGDETAYATLYKNNASLLYSYGLKLINDKELIKDCVQDLFVEIWNTKHRLGLVRAIKPYLFKAIRRKLIAESVKKRSMPIYLELSVNSRSYAAPSVEWNLMESQRFNQQKYKLKKALDMLTDRQKEIIHLKYYAQLRYCEIAEVMALSTKGAYKLMGRSIGVLRKHMEIVSFLEN